MTCYISNLTTTSTLSHRL